MKLNLIDELKNLLETQLKELEFITCIYGSYPNETAKSDSDIDLFIAVPENQYNDKLFNSIKTLIIEFHVQNKLGLDNEVPYERKLVYTNKEIIDALNYKGFNIQSNQILIPDVVKTKEFLSSQEIKLRLALNALTVPNFIFGNDQRMKDLIEEKVPLVLTLLAINLYGLKQFTIEDLVNILLRSKDGLEGELYLGYKDTLKVKEKIGKLLIKGTQSLVDSNFLVKILPKGFKIINTIYLSDFTIKHYE